MAKLTVEEVRDIIEMEGLDYAIQHYMSPEEIADPYLRKLFEKGRELLNKITDYVEENAKPEPVDEEEDEDA